MSVYFQQYNLICSLGDALEEVWTNLSLSKSGFVDLKKLNIVSPQFNVSAGAPYVMESLPLVSENKISDEYKIIISKLISGLVANDILIDALIVGCNVTKTEQYLSDEKFSDEQCLQYIQKELEKHGFSFSPQLETICLYNTCITGLSALSIAHDYIKAKKKEQVVVVTLEPRMRQWALMPLDFLNMLSREENCFKSSLPFSQERGGFVKGDGAAIAILGPEKNKFSKIELLGVSESNDRYRLTDPEENGAGIENSIGKVFSQSNIRADGIDFISAHATGTKKYDKIEAMVLQRIFGKTPAVTALKSQIGHTNISSALIAVIIASESLRRKKILPIVNFNADPEIEKLNFAREFKDADFKTALINSSGIGGNNACAVLRSL